MPVISYSATDNNQRLDLYLSEHYRELSRSYLANQINQQHIKVNSNPVKPSYILKYSDQIEINDQVVINNDPPEIEMPIIYEDNFCLVIDKPSGIITHAKGSFVNEASVATFISNKIDTELEGNRAGIVHRLDRGTSGVMITAKTLHAQQYLQRQFAKHQAIKTYYAVVSGKMSLERANINYPIERNPKQPSRFRVGVKGKSAVTNYQVVNSNIKYSLLELRPTTGRTHQLRVHLAAIKHPIVGDTFYKGELASRLMLHASSLSVILPNQGRVTFTSTLPIEFNDYFN